MGRRRDVGLQPSSYIPYIVHSTLHCSGGDGGGSGSQRVGSRIKESTTKPAEDKEVLESTLTSVQPTN